MVKYLQQYQVKEGDKFGLAFLYFLLRGPRRETPVSRHFYANCG